MGKWLRKVARKGKQLVEQAMDEGKLPDGGTLLDSVQDSLQGADLGEALTAVQETAQRCATASRETMEICDATSSKRDQMIEFASSIQSTLTNLGQDPSVLETVKELTNGSKVREAMELAKGLDVAAVQCVEKSTEMMDLMEAGMDKLPESVQTMLEKMAGDDDEDDDEEEALIEGLDRDLQDVQTCIEAIRQFNLATALKVGIQAFVQLTEKAKRSNELFVSVRGFASDVQDITQTFTEMKVSQFLAKGQQMMRCMGLLQVMRQVAQGAGKLLQVLIGLFEQTADRVSDLWSGLAFAKDCMQDSVQLVEKARALTVQAKTQSQDLMAKSRAIHGTLAGMKSLNRQSVQSMRELATGGEIQETIDLAKSMDDEVLQCTDQVSGMIDRVTEGFKNFPPILTDGFDMETAGKKEDDPEPLDVDEDVKELEASRQALEESDMINVIINGSRGFQGVSEKATICEKTMGLVEEFASGCKATVDSFMTVWDLESAAQKLQDMSRIVKLGEIMKQFAQQMKKLVLAILSLLKSAMEKLAKGIDLPEGVDEVVDAAKDKMEDAVDAAKDKLDDAVGAVKDGFKKKLKFWK